MGHVLGTVREAMASLARTVAPDDSVAEAARRLTEHSIGSAVALCLLVTLAGCNGLVGADDSARPTAAQVPADGPPGVDRTGSVRPVALLDNHTATIRGRSVTLRERRIKQFANGTVRRNLTRTVYAAGNGSYYVGERYRGTVAWNLGATAGRYERWGNGSVGVEAIIDGDGRRYGVNRPILQPVTRFDRLYLLLSTLKPTVAREVGDGVRLRAASATGVDRIASSGVEAPRNITLVAHINSEGLVQSYRLTYTGTVDGETVQVTERMAFADLGQTEVPRPAWVPEALEQLDVSPDSSRG